MTRRADARSSRRRLAQAGILACLLAAGGAALAASSQHTVTEHECLWDLSKRYYQDPYRWRDIAGANPLVKDPNLIYPGQVLQIPEAGPAARPKVELEAAAPVETGAAVPAAAPIETAAPVEVPAPQPAPVPAATVLPEPAAEMPPDVEAPPRAQGGLNEDSLSTKFPEGQAGQYPAFTRVQAPKGWKADGRVTEFDDEEIISGPGDLAEAKMAGKTPVRVGDRFYILRADVANEADADQEATYLQRVGVVRVETILPKGRVRLRVLKAGGAVEAGDLLSRQAL
ncbi:MAG: LysM peptidoglycan-binding domain-containing protein [Elusimicrobia bacterium]|nr:LysM peptidoglycan-binding domain-containing protein [Elusimicrobiota bacterium]